MLWIWNSWKVQIDAAKNEWLWRQSKLHQHCQQHINELKHKISQLDSKCKYMLANENMSSNVQVNNGNDDEDSKGENLLIHRSESRVKHNFKSTKANFDNSHANQDLENASFSSNRSFCDELMAKNLSIIKNINFK